MTDIIISTGTFRLVMADGAAAVLASAADLSGYTNHSITALDDGGKTAVACGYIGDSAEALGSELITGWTNNITFPFDTFQQSINDIISAIGSTTRSQAHTATFGEVMTGLCYKVESNLTLNSGAAPQLWTKRSSTTLYRKLLDPIPSGSSIYSFTGMSVSYTDNGLCVAVFAPTDFALPFSCKRYMALGTTALKVRNAATGSVQNWATIESGFNPDGVVSLTIRPLFNAAWAQGCNQLGG